MRKKLESLISKLNLCMEVAEILVAVLMVVIIFLGIGFLAERVFEGFQTHLFLGPVEIHHFLDIALVVFIVVEMFRITIAYLTGKRTWDAVLEAAFVAIGRKIVLYEYGEYGIYGALALVALTLAVVLAYYLTRKAEKINPYIEGHKEEE